MVLHSTASEWAALIISSTLCHTSTQKCELIVAVQVALKVILGALATLPTGADRWRDETQEKGDSSLREVVCSCPGACILYVIVTWHMLRDHCDAVGLMP